MATAFQRNSSTTQFGFLSRIAKSDKAAAQECVDAYGAMIWTLTKQLTDSDESAEKAVQEVFIDIWENAAFCDLTVSDEKVWIALIARRRLVKYAAKAVL